jgi:hypothetical protein
MKKQPFSGTAGAPFSGREAWPKNWAPRFGELGGFACPNKKQDFLTEERNLSGWNGWERRKYRFPVVQGNNLTPKKPKGKMAIKKSHL